MKKKKIVIYALSFFIPLLIILILTLMMRFLFFNSISELTENLMLSDMYGQYISLYNYIRGVFVGQNSIFYSFSHSLGGNMASTIGYYLASPFNLLYVFVEKANIPIMIFITYALKISLCSLFMCIFLSYNHGHKYMNIIFSLCYAFIGFTTVYYFNNMWLDVIYMTPLVILGIEQLFEGKQNTYIITLSLSIIFNFYMAYMLCIFCLIYFIYRLLIKYKIKDFNKYKKSLFRFVFSSLIAVGLSSFLLIPSILNLSGFMRSPLDVRLLNINFIDFFTSFFNKIVPKTYLGSHFYIEIVGRERPVIYVGLFCVILFVFYYFNNKIQKREKILSFSVLLVFILSFIIPIFKLIWQGFSFPNGYIDRFSFLYCFFIIYIASNSFYTLGEQKLKKYIFFIIIYVLISLYVSVLNLDFLSNFNIFLSVIFVIIFISIYILFVRSKNRTYCIHITVFVIIELTYNSWYNLTLMYSGSNYSNYQQNICNQINEIDNNFYRIDGNLKYNYLNDFLCNTNGIESSISTNNKKIYDFFYNTGGTISYITVYYDFNELPIFNSMLGVKYVYSNEKLYNNFYNWKNSFNYEYYDLIEEITKSEEIYVYENPYALSLGYVVDESILNFSFNNPSKSFENLNNFINVLSDTSEKFLVPLEKEKIDDDKYNFVSNTKNKNIYLSFDYDISLYLEKHGEIYINGEYYDDIGGDNLGMIKLKNKSVNKEILIEINDETDTINDVNLYYFDLKLFEKAIAKLKKNQLNDVVVEGNKVSGNIVAPKDSLLFLSIPYEKGWNVYVDGKKVSYKKIADTFIGIDLTEGEHKIEMKFYSPGLLVGGLISALSFFGLITFNLFNKKRKHYNKNIV